MKTPRGDRGDTLIELIVTVAIMGVALVAILGAIGTAIVMSNLHRKQAEAGAAARELVEAIENTVADEDDLRACSAVGDYATPAGFSWPGFTPSIAETRSWNGDAWQNGCVAGARMYSLTVAMSENDPVSESLRVVETVTVVLRRP